MSNPTSIRAELLAADTQVEDGAPIIRGGLILGIPLLGGGARRALDLLGYTYDGGFWRNGRERYTESRGNPAELSLEEMEGWRVELLDTCIRNGRVLALPDAMTVDAAKGAIVRLELDFLLYEAPRLRVATPPELDRNAQIAVWMAKHLLKWPEAVRVLLEHFTMRRYDAAEARAKRSETQEAILAETPQEDRGDVIRQLAIRYGALEGGPADGDISDTAFGGALDRYLAKVFA